MPADNITRAIKKGTGELEGVVYEELTFEGVGVDGVLIIVETVTDNKNRTAPELKKIFEKHGGSLGGSGTAQWAFDHKGVVRINKSAISEENLLEIVGESGAEDIAADDDQWVITCPPVAFGSVRDAVDAAKLKVIEGKLEHLPKTPKKVTGENAETLMNMLDLLDEHDDVQQLFSEAEFE